MTGINSKIPAWVNGRTSPKTAKGLEVIPIVTEVPIAATKIVATEAVPTEAAVIEATAWMKKEECSDEQQF